MIVMLAGLPMHWPRRPPWRNGVWSAMSAAHARMAWRAACDGRTP